MRSFVDVSHDTDLLGSLVGICLIDAQRIGPEHESLTLSRGVGAEFTQCKCKI
jgi:hypothetical protein